MAKAHGIPFYVAAPYSTIDVKTQTGDDIPIEERAREEVMSVHGSEYIAPNDVNILNPAFDVTPAEYISGIITERGVFCSKGYSERVFSLKMKLIRLLPLNTRL